MLKTKYIFVVGGVLSGVGKGITAASIGAVLKARGLKVNIQKCDPYFNVDAGTLNPSEHGEVFVTADGAETDLDLGHYERFLDIELNKQSSTMSGRIIAKVIEDERAGKYLGKTVQIIPHVTNAMQQAIIDAGKGFDVHIVEVGGTIGDYESTAFTEAIRQLKTKVGHENCLYVHVVYLPYLDTVKEIKSKPAQNAVRDLREAGIQPDLIVARADHEIPRGIVKKLSLFTDVEEEAIIPMETVRSVYQVPEYIENLGIGDLITEKLGLPRKKPNLKTWNNLVKSIFADNSRVIKIGIVAKYLDNQDTYLSVVEALKAACWQQKCKLELIWIDAEKLSDDNVKQILKPVDGIVVPGGFGSRGIEGKISAAKYAITNNIPYLGLCLGMQVAAIAAVRLSGKNKANSVEFDPKTPDPVISLMEEQKSIIKMGGTMRLGDYECKLAPSCNTCQLYKSNKITERHRHRYEFNPKYTELLKKQGIEVVGVNPKSKLAEVLEGTDKAFFVATQAHPEFKSRPYRPHPLFVGFINSIIK